MTEFADFTADPEQDPSEGTRPAGPVTPADAADAARLVSFGLHPKLVPARDAEYTELLRRYRDEPVFRPARRRGRHRPRPGRP